MAECGPRLELLKSTGERIGSSDPLAAFALHLLQGQIGAVKGLGGFHLVCDARNEIVVKELRRRKHRDERPFAVMVWDVATVQSLCELNPQERELLGSQRRPIVLLKKRTPSDNANAISEAVAPGNPYLGVMLPYTPLHFLMMEAADGVPLVLTSGNRADEPIAYTDTDALERLADIADVFLTHNREIHVRCDDSVTRIVDGLEQPVRRSRGYAPEPVKLPSGCTRPVLAVGGQLKGVFALGRDRQAFLSHHLGDLDHYAAYAAFERDVRRYEQLFDVRPELIVHDLHPDYASTTYAKERAAREGLELLGVQHHHAHLASSMAEHGLEEPVIGVCFDGTGFGTDGAIWGGEFLMGDLRRFTRAAHLRYVPLPGGDKAVREPWRMAASHLWDAGCENINLLDVSFGERRTIERMIERNFNSPMTSSMGRLFDAVAAITGVRSRVRYEGQAAIELEWLATDVPAAGSYPFEVTDSIDTRPLIRAVVEDLKRQTNVGTIARQFHSSLVEMIAAICQRVRSNTQVEAVVLSGGVFLNALLTREATARLKADGFRVYRHRLVPPNDGGLALGQLAIAAAAINAPPSDHKDSEQPAPLTASPS